MKSFYKKTERIFNNEDAPVRIIDRFYSAQLRKYGNTQRYIMRASSILFGIGPGIALSLYTLINPGNIAFRIWGITAFHVYGIFYFGATQKKGNFSFPIMFFATINFAHVVLDILTMFDNSMYGFDTISPWVVSVVTCIYIVDWKLCVFVSSTFSFFLDLGALGFAVMYAPSLMNAPRMTQVFHAGIAMAAEAIFLVNFLGKANSVLGQKMYIWLRYVSAFFQVLFTIGMVVSIKNTGY